MTLTDNALVLALWWVAVGLTVLVIVPVAVYLLHRTWQAARSIRRFTAETLSAGAGIAGHTENIPALDRTIELAGGVAEKGHRLRTATAELAFVLRQRAE